MTNSNSGNFAVAAPVNGSTATFTIPHGLGVVPDGISVTPANDDACYSARANSKPLAISCTADATNIIVNYSPGGCPASGTSPSWWWVAIQN